MFNFNRIVQVLLTQDTLSFENIFIADLTHAFYKSLFNLVNTLIIGLKYINNFDLGILFRGWTV